MTFCDSLNRTNDRLIGLKLLSGDGMGQEESKENQAQPDPAAGEDGGPTPPAPASASAPASAPEAKAEPREGAPPPSPPLPLPAGLGTDSLAFGLFRFFVIIVIAVLALPNAILAVSTNAERWNQLAAVDNGIQRITLELGKGTSDAARLADIKTQLSKLESDRASIVGEVGYGNYLYWNHPRARCVFFPGSRCFHKNSSEHNNILLAMAAGVIGAILGVALSAYSNRCSVQLCGAMWRFLTGGTVGLLMLLAIKSLKGPALTTVSDALDLNAPWGIAFACTLAGLFADDFIRILDGLFKRLADKLSGTASAPAPAEATAAGGGKDPTKTDGGSSP